MKMSKLEKKFVNSMKQGRKNVETAERLFRRASLGNVKDVLEVGCGIGFLASYLARQYDLNITGIDLDPDQLSRARANGNGVDHLRFLEGDATGLPFDNDRFDMVLSFDVLHHIPRWDTALSEVGRVLRLNGMYVLNDLALPRFAADSFEGFLKNHMGVYSVDHILSELRRNNLDPLYLERPTLNVFMRHFSVVSQRRSAG
jgi:ubiquinone/menaquinone biosynthesis C-methylase UbiE